ncbi:MAG: alpha/beta hydrolase [Acidimicrobiales bacterium]|nr:alpha/beta hydrolase [Acidimicrobiales bacterium]
MPAHPSPIVLLHGTGMDSSMWAGFRSALERSGVDAENIYALDLLGHGSTPRPSRPLHIDDYVRQVRKFIIQTNVGAVQLVGHSLGGLVALAVAATHPDVVTDVVVIGVPYGRSDAQRNEWLDLIMKAGSTYDDESVDPVDNLSEVIAELGNRWCGHGDRSRQAVADRVGSLDAKTFGLVFRISMTSESLIAEFAPEIGAPVVVAAGDADREVDAAGVDELARTLANGRAEIISGHHHLSIIDEPEPYVELLS